MQKQALSIVKKLREQGYKAYFAGGCVRDRLMGIAPGDIDVATSAEPNVILNLFPHTFEKGKAFGVTSVLIDDIEIEVATFRKEGKYSDGRHPDHVEWTDDKQDALRRDFTINGMFFDPFENKIIDYVQGQEDLKRKVIRTIGNPYHRFDEDKLRMMRAIRFSARFQYPIESDTRKAILELSPKMTEVSQERIREELVKILTQANPQTGLQLLSEVGLLKVILPEIEAMKGVEQPPQFHPEGDVFVHTLLLFKHIHKNPSPELAIAALLHDVGKPPTFTIKERIRFDGHTDLGAKMAEKIMKRLRFSRKQIEHVASLVKQHLQFMNVKQMRESTLKRFLGQEGFEDHLELHRLDCLACHGILDNYEFCKEKLAWLKQKPLPMKPLLSGKDLIRTGFKPGPLFKEILTSIETAQLENVLTSKKQALDFAKKHFSTHLSKRSPQTNKKKRPHPKK